MKLFMRHDPFNLDPVSSFSDLRRDMSRLFDFTFPGFGQFSRGFSQSAFGGVDLYRVDNKFVLRAELPGVARDKISVDVVDRKLVLTVDTASDKPATTPESAGTEVSVDKPAGEAVAAQHSEKQEDAKQEVCSDSCKCEARYSRSFALPAEVDNDRISARYENGVLTVELPQREQAKPRSITVEVS
jgi:HSP20 family protein